ncbi:MAG: hypothetical protein C0504_05595, partial [Candidatus Solibacter sp.]|nr:hypothetical protein [Candidatus Solibacter sp.]
KKEFDTWPITVGDGRRQIQQFIFSALPGTAGGTWQGSINGGQGFSHEILIDGISIGRMDIQGGSNNEFSPSAESVSEFKLQTGTTSAQYSGGQTAVANFATKSGTNELHGTGYWYVQNDALRANGYNNNASGIKRQPYKQNNYGYSVGGPVILPKVYNGKNRTFFFHNFEQTRLRDFRSTTFTQLPIPAFKSGDFSRLFDPAFTGNSSSGTSLGNDAAGRAVRFGAIYDPTTSRQIGSAWVRDVFPGNIVPRDRFSPVSRKILELAPIDDPMFDTMLRNMPSIGVCCPIFNEKMLTIKGDHNINSNHRLSATLNRNFRRRFNSPGGRWGNPPGTPTGVYQDQNTPGTMGRMAYSWTISPTVLNYLNIGYNRFGNFNESAFVDQDWPQKIGLQNVPGTHFPTLTFAGQPHQGSGIGASGRLGSANRGGSFNGSTIITNDLTVVRAKHNVKFGFETRRYFYNSINKSGSGTFAFNSNTTALPGFLNQTGHSFASMLLGAVTSTSREESPVNFGHRTRSAGFYVQDDWKVTRKLTLNVGLRWEMIGGLVEVAGRMSGLSFDAVNPSAGNLKGALVFVDDMKRRGFQDTNWMQLSPKFGFAYAATPKFVVRGGYGINNSPAIANGWGFGGTLGYSGSIVKNTGNTALRFAQEPVMYLHDPYPSLTQSLPNKNPSLSNGMGITYTAADSNRLPYVQNWNFGFQYQLPASTVLEINYVGNKGTRLMAYGLDQMNNLPFSAVQQYGDLLTRPWNAATGVREPFPGFAGTVLQALRPYPQFTGIGQAFPNFGTSSYNGLQVQATRHFSKGVSLLAAYTFSKSIGLMDDAIEAEGVADVFNRGLERSITGLNFPQSAKFTWIYELPIGPNKLVNINGMAGKILGGWQLTGIHTLRSGSPIGIGTGGYTNPFGTIRADRVLGEKIILDSDAPINFRGFSGGKAFLNRAAFTTPPVFPGGQLINQRLGTLGPLLPNIRNAHFISEDLGVYKQFSIDEHKSFELRGTFLNPFNRVGRGGLITNITDPNFGQFTGQQMGGRNIEISARVTF